MIRQIRRLFYRGEHRTGRREFSTHQLKGIAIAMHRKMGEVTAVLPRLSAFGTPLLVDVWADAT